MRYVLDRDDVDKIRDLIASTLSINMRLLHHIIRRIFIFKTDIFDFVSKRKLALMYYLIQGTSMNLLDLMLVLMREAVKKVKICLPYGMVLTQVFKTFNVSLKESPLRSYRVMINIMAGSFIGWGTRRCVVIGFAKYRDKSIRQIHQHPLFIELSHLLHHLKHHLHPTSSSIFS